MRRMALAFIAVAGFGCDSSPTGPGSDSGALTVVVAGVNTGLTASVRVLGVSPGSTLDTTISQTTTFAALRPATYSVSSGPIVGATTLYAAAGTQSVTVAKGQTATARVRYSTLPITGTHVPALDAFDSTMIAFMAARNIRAGTLAISRGGVLLYSRAFGWRTASQSVALSPDAMFRLASVSKPVTAAAVRKLIAAGAFALSTPVFEYLQLTPAGTVVDQRIYDVTVSHLLTHNGGWNRDIFGDFVFAPRTIAQEMGLSAPPTKTQVAQWAMTKPLQFTPGAGYTYSNFGYSLLGMMIEKATGMPYLDYVKANVFSPAVTSQVMTGRSLPADRGALEAFYSHPTSGCLVFDVSTCTTVPYADGAMHLEAFDSFAGLVASAPAIVSFLDSYWISGQPRSGNGLAYNFYGSLPGTYTLARQRADGVNYVVLFNQRTDPSGLAYDTIMQALDQAVMLSSEAFSS
jgi:CubicO group peptidase (beta-lactamase class C family)